LEGDIKMKTEEIRKMTSELAKLYPIEYNYGSKCSLYQIGINAGIVTEEEYNAARDFYGRLWDYTGD
jgi:hypothetical protein